MLLWCFQQISIVEDQSGTFNCTFKWKSVRFPKVYWMRENSGARLHRKSDLKKLCLCVFCCCNFLLKWIRIRVKNPMLMINTRRDWLDKSEVSFRVVHEVLLHSFRRRKNLILKGLSHPTEIRKEEKKEKWSRKLENIFFFYGCRTRTIFIVTSVLLCASLSLFKLKCTWMHCSLDLCCVCCWMSRK